MNFAVFSAICTAELAAASQPPNVLFVVGDDVGYSDFGELRYKANADVVTSDAGHELVADDRCAKQVCNSRTA